MRSFAIAVVLTVFSISFSSAQIPQIERDALIALYHSSNGAEWRDSMNWRNAGDTDFSPPGTECTWIGVLCDAEPSVRYLRLHSNELSGTLPSELGNLSRLLRLELHQNELSGSIPVALGNLLELEALWLPYNRLSGRIPVELGNLSNLDDLRLQSNFLTGSLPAELGDLSSLHILYVRNNQLSGGIPPELGNLSALSNLRLNNNQLSGSIPTELGDLTGLASTFDQTNIGHNALWTDDPTLQAFLDSRDPDWDETQTIAPANLVMNSSTTTSVTLSWIPPFYTADTGGYIVTASDPSGTLIFNDTFETGDTSAWSLGPLGKATAIYTVVQLHPNTTYTFEVRMYTDPVPAVGQTNTVISEPASVQGTTQSA